MQGCSDSVPAQKIAGRIRASSPSHSEMRSCPCCTSRDWKPALRVRRASLSQCANCKLLATTAYLPNHVELEGLYDVACDNHNEYRTQYLDSRLSIYKQVLPKLSRFFKTSRMLEIGSGYGYFLEIASQAGWQIEGIEISKYACEVARSRGSIVHQKNLLAVDLDPGSYDVIAMWDVIEHLTDVEKVVDRCIALLRPGGALVARTPDARALHYEKGLFDIVYRHLAYPANTAEHVFHFTPDRLSFLLARKGLREIEIDTSNNWEERSIPGRNLIVRLGRYLILRRAYAMRCPYEFVVTAVKS